MATATAKITIGGQEVDPYQVSIKQTHNWHHSFEIAVAVEKIEEPNAFRIDNSVSYVGQEAEILIENPKSDDPPVKFKGIITSVHIDRVYTGDNLIILAGFSPTYLLDEGIGVKSYEEKSIADIVNEIIGEYPGNLMNPTVSPQYTEAIPYIVRYKETAYQFLSRIAATYGEWFFYDGQSIIFGELPKPDKLKLVMGDGLNSFGYGVNIRPSKFKYQIYNYQENKPVEYSSAGFSPGWLDDYAQKALDTADGLYPSEPLNPIWHDAREDKQVKHLAETQRAAVLSNTTFFVGSGHNTGISVGGLVEALVINSTGGSKSEDSIDNFRIISVTHMLSADKEYTNEFEAIPLSVTSPPSNKHVFKPEAESQVAVVTDNNDPDKLGRIRVRFKWQKDPEMTPWIRIVTNHASVDRGMYIVPEIDDEVYIGFEQGNPDRPYMLGAHYHGKTPPQFFDPDNNLKAFKTRSGHTFLWNDKDGEESITILDKSGNTMVFNTKESSIFISAPKTITMKATDINLIAENSINMTAKPGDNGGDGVINLTAEKQYKLTVNEKNGLEIKGDKGEAKLVSTKKMEVGSDKGETIVSAKKDMVVSGKKLNMKGSQKAVIQSADTDII